MKSASWWQSQRSPIVSLNLPSPCYPAATAADVLWLLAGPCAPAPTEAAAVPTTDGSLPNTTRRERPDTCRTANATQATRHGPFASAAIGRFVGNSSVLPAHARYCSAATTLAGSEVIRC